MKRILVSQMPETQQEKEHLESFRRQRSDSFFGRAVREYFMSQPLVFIVQNLNLRGECQDVAVFWDFYEAREWASKNLLGWNVKEQVLYASATEVFYE